MDRIGKDLPLLEVNGNRLQFLGMVLCVLVFGIPSWGGAAVSSAVKVDQVGYLPNETKLAMITSTSATGPVTLKRVSDNVAVWNGTLTSSAYDADSGDNIRIADFSSFTTAGSYYLEVSGVGNSYNFDIGDNVFQSAYRLALMSFYTQRCGTAVAMTVDGVTYQHAICHAAAPCNDRPSSMHSSTGQTGTRQTPKGWHDAGDFGKYIVNSGISTGELLWTYEWFSGKPYIQSDSLGIPESGNGVPDLLDEIRWNIDWMLTMQDTDGGVWHKNTSAGFGDMTLPEDDTAGTRFVIGRPSAPYKTSASTADFISVMAIAARLYDDIPATASFATTCLNAAVTAWTWLQANPNVTYTQPAGITTGGYGDSTLTDERLWAAAEMFRTTGGAAYNNYFTSNYTAFNPRINPTAYPQDWGNVRNLGMWSYYFAPGANATAVNEIRTATLNAAATIVNRTNAKGYRVSLDSSQYVWGSNGGVANYGIFLIVANAMQASVTYTNHALNNLHYLLGRNTHNVSFVTHVGDKPFLHPHNRPSASPEYENLPPWPGLLSGGPNSSSDDGSGLDALPSSPPAKRWVDETASYASNENAINWNAPLVFLLAYTLPNTVVGTPTPTVPPTRTFTPTRTATPTTTHTLTATRTGTPTVTNTNTSTRTHTFTVTPTITATRTNSPTVTGTFTPTRTNTLTVTRTGTPTATGTPTMTNTSTLTFTRTLTRTFTQSPTLSATRSSTPTVTNTHTTVFTNTPTPTITHTWTLSRTLTFTATPTNTMTATSSSTRTATPSSTLTSTITRTSTATVTHTFTLTVTRTFTQSPTLSATRSSTSTATNTHTSVFTNTFTPTVTNSSTNTITVTRTPSRTTTPTITDTPVPSATVTNTQSPTLSATRSSTPTLTHTFTSTHTNSATFTPSPSLTPTTTRTATDTVTRTFTLTVTNTATATNTATITNTPVPSATATPTFSNTASFTSTSTATPTFTRTRTNTQSPTLSATRSSTPTITNTPVPSATATPTFTNTASFTSTSTATMTNTMTVTPIPSLTMTYSSTPTFYLPTSTSSPTATHTLVPSSTATPTFTETDTLTPTDTNTPTSTRTATSSNTRTSTASFTPSPTETSTPTVTPTETWTPTSTDTFTAVPSATPSGTFTQSPTLSPTRSSTPSPTFTLTPTFTSTFTYTATLTWTLTRTWTGIPTQTPTRTLSFTGTSTDTPTWTWTATWTQTATATHSPTATHTGTATETPEAAATATPTPGTLDLQVSYPYPNPVGGDQVAWNLVLPGTMTVEWQVFTTAYRKIREERQVLQGECRIVWDLKDRKGTPVADGLYHVRVTVGGTTRITQVLVMR